MTEDGDEDRLWTKVSEMLTETCSRPEGFNPKSWAQQCSSAAKLIQEWIGVHMLEALGRHVTIVHGYATPPPDHTRIYERRVVVPYLR